MIAPRVRQYLFGFGYRELVVLLVCDNRLCVVWFGAMGCFCFVVSNDKLSSLGL